MGSWARGACAIGIVLLVWTSLPRMAGAADAEPSALALTPAEKSWLEARPTVVLALDEFNPPLNFRRVDAEGPSFSGANVDYMNLIASKARFSLRFEGSTWAEALDKALAHRVDGVPGARLREERKLKLNFTETYLEMPIAMATRGAHARVRTLSAFASERIAVRSNTVRIPLMRSHCPSCSIVEVNSPRDGMSLLGRGEVDGFFDDLPVVQHEIDQAGGALKVALLYYYSEAGANRVALRNTAPELLSIFNKAIAAITVEEHEAIRRRWLRGAEGASVQRDLLLTEAQRTWLAAHPVIRVVVDGQRAPIESIGPDGQFQGISIEYLHRIEELLGIRFELLRHVRPATALENLDEPQADVFASLVITPKREQSLLFTAPYITTPLVIFASVQSKVSGLSSLEGRRVAVVRGLSSADLLRRDWPGVELLEVANVREGLEAVRRGDAQAYLGPLVSSTHQLMESGITDVRVVGDVDQTFHYGMAVRRDWPELAAILDQALEAIPKTDRDRFRQKWTTQPYEREADYRLIAALLGAVALAVGFIVQLRTMVGRRTAELQREVTVRRAKEGELDRLNVELEERVRERTAELEGVNQALAVARDQAESATRAKSEFLANMSHEIRTPMNAIIGMNELAMRAGVTPRQQGYLSKARSAAASLLVIINDILDFSKIEAGKLEMEHRPFLLQGVFDKVAAAVTLQARERGLEVLISTAPDVPQRLIGDSLRLEQVLINLCSNAVKFTPDGEVVVVTTRATAVDEGEGVLLRFSVRDTGVGMDPQQMQGLFQPFNQLDASTTRRHGGTGLGLAISKKLVAMMGGEIGVSSQPGAGSDFHFTAVFGMAAEADVSLTPQALADLGDLRILVVDDSVNARDIFQNLLGSLGFRATLANSGAEGLAEVARAAAAKPYDLVLLDWKMPGLDGFETAQRIRASHPSGRGPRIVLVTAWGDDALIHRAVVEGLDGCLTKPVSPSTLLDTLMAAFVFGTPEGGHSAAPAETGSNVPAALAGRRVLLVEDNEFNQIVATELLRSVAGMSVTVAGNGLEALELLREESFDVVLMDVQMPVMDGYQATALIRQQAGLGSLPIIAMTAHAMLRDREKCLAVGMNDYVTKPFEVVELFAALAKWMPGGAAAQRLATQGEPT